MEYTQSMDKLGSVIIESNDGTTVIGGLYLGGYRPSINRQFLQRQRITHILNTAAGLVKFFGPKYEVRNKNVCASNRQLRNRLMGVQANIFWGWS